MNTKNLKNSIKKLRLKKAVISNLSISEENLKLLRGGDAAKITTDTTSIFMNTCTSNDTK
jgi:hypothetical protein